MSPALIESRMTVSIRCLAEAAPTDGQKEEERQLPQFGHVSAKGNSQHIV